MGSKDRQKPEENLFSKSEVQKKIVKLAVQEVSRFLFWFDDKLSLDWLPIEKAILEELEREEPRKKGVLQISSVRSKVVEDKCEVGGLIGAPKFTNYANNQDSIFSNIFTLNDSPSPVLLESWFWNRKHFCINTPTRENVLSAIPPAFFSILLKGGF